jgi:hypothetical protein
MGADGGQWFLESFEAMCAQQLILTVRRGALGTNSYEDLFLRLS